MELCLLYNYIIQYFVYFKKLLSKLVNFFWSPVKHQNVWNFFKNNFWNIWINVLMKLVWKHRNNTWNLSTVQRHIYNPVENFSFSLLTIFAKKLYLRCSVGSSISRSLKLTIKAPEQRQACHSYVFIFDFEHILNIACHAYFSYFAHKFMFPFFWTGKRPSGRFSKNKINRWQNTLLKFLSRKSFYI